MIFLLRFGDRFGHGILGGVILCSLGQFGGGIILRGVFLNRLLLRHVLALREIPGRVVLRHGSRRRLFLFGILGKARFLLGHDGADALQFGRDAFHGAGGGFVNLAVRILF
ncbi:hypothetical protein, partial [Sulfitobacter sp. HI0129]|uniref:hypothetical protein n=1 Tax=Sulfitobacter sp. HI0129 TaxID=1822268 RepID=UPI001237900F